MHLSNYLKIWSCQEPIGYRLLYSTHKGSTVLLAEDQYEMLFARQTLPDDLLKPLTELGMLVSDPEKEKQQAFGMLAEINRLNPNLNILVVLNLDCNFSCQYCYEGNMKGKAHMGRDTADQFIEYVKTRFLPGKEKLVLDFYGGEPLLSVSLIKYLSESLKPLIESRGGSYEFGLVTNGSLLKRKTVIELAALGLKGAKVTLDGPPEIHNQFRPFKNGAPSFDVIVNNIRDCCDLIRISVNGNFTRDNHQFFPSIFDHFSEKGITPDKLSQMSFHPVMQVSDQFSSPEFSGGCTSANDPWVAPASIQLRREILKRGYRNTKITPSPCMVDVDDAMVVNHDGGIFKCITMIGHDDFKVGDIWTGTKDYAETYHLDHWRRNEECGECEYLPLCFGGCRYMKFQRDGEMAGVDCQRSFWDATLETLIKQQVEF